MITGLRYSTLSNIPFYALLLVALFSVVTIRPPYFFEYTKILEFLFIFLVLLNFGKLHYSTLPFVVLSSVYVVVSFLYTIPIVGNHFLDFIMSYKAFVYVILLSFFVKKDLFSSDFLQSIFDFLIIAFIIRYLSLIFMYGEDRPILFDENNFELMFLTLAFIAVTYSKNNFSNIRAFGLAFVVLLSGSRSAVLILLCVLILIKFKKLSLTTAVSAVVSFIFLSMLVSYIFISRSGGEFSIENIDRFKFMMVFIDEVKEWPFYKFLLGAGPLTALNPSSCETLSFYENLFSFRGDGSCYAVIFHSYILRAIFEHGVLGFLFLVFFIYRVLKVSGIQIKYILAVLAVLLVNGLSVSSMNSIYFILGIVLILGSYKPPAIEKEINSIK